MSDAHAKAVEAARLAVNERRGMPAAITAYLATMRAEEGWVLVRDVEAREMTSGDGIIATIHRGYDGGWNACRAAMLGGADDER